MLNNFSQLNTEKYFEGLVIQHFYEENTYSSHWLHYKRIFFLLL